MHLLLLSNSANPGEDWLEWPLERIGRLLGGARRVLFVPYAAVRFSWDEYADRFRRRIEPLGVEVQSAHAVASPGVAARDADVIAVGGGNTFQLLANLYAAELIDPIRQQVSSGAKYLGWSAGSVVACPTLGTTNDMPVVQPASHDALGLVPFQINAHYTEAHLPNHGGETRVERLLEYVIANPGRPVVGLPEGTGIEVTGDDARLFGVPGCVIYRGGSEAERRPAGASLSDLLQTGG